MKPTNRPATLLLSSLLLLSILACQTIRPQSAAMPSATATVSTPTVPPPTLTSTPISEEVIWKSRCTSLTGVGQIGVGRVNDISFSENQKLTAISAGAGLVVYDHEKQSEVLFVAAKAPLLQSVFIKDDTEILAMDKDYRLVILDIQTGTVVDGTDPVDVMTARLSDDGSLVLLADWRGVTRVYDTQEYNEIASTEAYIDKNAAVTLFIGDLVYSSVQFSADLNLVMTAAFSGRITVFDAQDGTLVAEYPLKQPAFPENVTFSGDSKYLAIDYREEDGTQHIKVLSIKNGFLRQTFQGINPALSSDGRLLASQDPVNDKIMVWEVSTGKLLHEFSSMGHLVGELKFSVDNQSLFSSSTKGIDIWSVGEATKPGRLPGEFSNYRQVAMDGNERFIALRSDHYIEVRDFETGELITEILAGEPIEYIAFNAEGTKLAGIVDDRIVTWNPVDGSVMGELTLSADFVAFTGNPDELILGKNYKDVTVLKLEDGRVVSKDRNDSLVASTFTASLDGTLIATSHYETGITLSRPNEWKIIKRLDRPDKAFDALALTPSGMVLAAATRDRKIKVWSTDGDLLCTLRDQPKSVRSLAFAPDGNTLFIVAGEDGYVRTLGAASRAVPGEAG